MSQVSKLWRQIAVDSPRLWCRISVLRQQHVDLYATRSKNTPLEISLRSPGSGKAIINSRITASIASLIPHLSRWRSFSISRLNPEFYWDQLLNNPAPILEELSICISSWHTPPKNTSLFTGNLPRLQSLNLNGLNIPLSSPVYKGLTSLRIEGVTFAFSITNEGDSDSNRRRVRAGNSTRGGD